MHGNRAEGGKGRRLEVHRVGQRDKQVARHDGILGVDSESAASAGHTLSNLEALHVLTQPEDGARRGITQRHRLVEAAEGGLQRGDDAFALGLVEHLLDQVGTRAGLAEIAFFRELNDHALGARGHEAGRRFDKGHPRARSRDGHVHDGGSAVLHILEELFHLICNFRFGILVWESIPEIGLSGFDREIKLNYDIHHVHG